MSTRTRRTGARRNANKRYLRLAVKLESLEDRTLLNGSPTWQVQSDYFGTRDTVSEPRSLRGLALSADSADLYGGFIQGTTSAAIREVSSGVNANLIGNDGGSPTNSYGANPAYTTGLEAKVTTYNQAKGLDTDDRGYVYATLSSGSNTTTQQWAIYSSDLSAQVAIETSTNFIAARTLAGIATAKLGGNYYVYVGWQNGQIERWNVNNPAAPALDTSWGSAAHPGTISLKTINANAYLDGLTIDGDGTIYVAGGLQGSTSYGDSLIKIPAAAAASGDLATATHVDVQGGANGSGGYAAMDVALFGDQAYVTEYLADNSTIAVFNKSDLSSAGIITPSDMTGPSGLNATYSTGADSGLSGIDISSDGKIYVAEQLYNYVASVDSYTPPGGTAMTGTRTYFDRVLVSSALGVSPAITSGDSTTFTTGAAGSFTVISTGVPDPTLSETGALPSGVTFVDNGDGTATLAGTPAAGTGGVYSISITADNGVSPAALQAFTLTVDQAPAVTSAAATTFTTGAAGTFTVTTSGFPVSALGETGALPSGVTFVDNGDGTATLAGTPAAGTGGVYSISFTADNGVAPAALQAFTLTVDQAPAITSAAATTFTTGAAGTFTVTTSGFPVSALNESGALPGGVTFVDSGDGTATLAGTPAAGTGGVYSISFTADNGVAPAALQAFTLTVDQAPAVTSAAATTFTTGAAGTFTVTTSGFPVSALGETGALPSGVTFVDNGDGTATLAGTPAAGTGGVYSISITADNGVAPAATQSFTLTVNQAPAVTSAASTTFAEGAAGTFTVTTSGFPVSTLTESGALPGGVTFVDNGDGTATLAGTPVAGTGGVYSITLTAHNGVSPDATQAFTFTVSTKFGYLAGVPGDGTPQTFVRNLYRELLGREPDAAGEAHWVSYAQNHPGAAGNAIIVQAFLNSAEYKTHYVITLYQVFLGRTPDANGLQYWTEKMSRPGTPGMHGGSADEKYVLSAILGSDEYYNRAGGTPQGWVNAIYEDILGRAPDSGGAAYWEDKLAAGSRDSVARRLLSQEEVAHDLLDSFYPAPGGTAANPLPPAGAQAGAGLNKLALITGGGWENLYLNGPYDHMEEGNDLFFRELADGAAWDDVQYEILTSAQYFNNGNQPVT